MKITNNSLALFFAGVIIFTVFNSYDHLNFVEISMNQASAVTSSEISKEASLKKEKIKVDVVEKVDKKVESFFISSAHRFDLRIEKTLGHDFIIRLEGSSDEYKDKGTKLSDWFQDDFKNGKLTLRDYEKKKYSFNGLSDLKKMAQSFKGNVQSHDGLVMVIQLPEAFEFNELNVELVASSIRIENIVFKKMIIKTVSGDLDVKGSEGNIIEIASVSGNNVLEVNKIKTAKFETVSGETFLIARDSDASITYESVSGNFKLKLPRETDIDVNFESMSGVLKNEFGLSKKASAQLKFSSLSGNAAILKTAQ